MRFVFHRLVLFVFPGSFCGLLHCNPRPRDRDHHRRRRRPGKKNNNKKMVTVQRVCCVFLRGNIRLIPMDQQNWSSTSNDVHSVLSDDLLSTDHCRHSTSLVMTRSERTFPLRSLLTSSSWPADTLLLLLLFLWLLLLLLLFSSLGLMRSDGDRHIILSADFSSYTDDKSRKIDPPLIYPLIHLREFTVNACSSYIDLDIRSGDVSSDVSNERGFSPKEKRFLLSAGWARFNQ